MTMPRFQLVIWAALILLQCSNPYKGLAETTIDAPTSLTMYRERGETRVAASASRVYVSQTVDRLKEVPLPDGIRDATGDIVIGVVELSADERSVFIGTQGGDGLYRYDFSTSEWRAIRPPGAPASISAITISSDSSLIVGCGGYATNTASDAAGLFRSDDNGETWEQIPLIYDGNEAAPGIRALAASSTGKLMISCKGFNGTIPSGVFELAADGVLRKVFTNPATSMKWVGDRGYFLQGGFVSSYIRSGENIRVTTIWDATSKCQSISTWHDDSLLVHVRTPDNGNRALILVDTSVVGTLDLSFIRSNRIVPSIYATTVGDSKGVLSFGCGRNVVAIVSDGSVQAVHCDPERPEVVTLASAMQWGLADVASHGWFRINGDDVAVYDEHLSSELISFPGVNHSALNDAVMFTNSGMVRLVRRDTLDTLLDAAGQYSLYDAALNRDESLLYVAHSKGFAVVSISNQEITDIELDGWPKYFNAASGDSAILICEAVFHVGDRLYAWASGGLRPVDTHDFGGLFEYNGSTWQKIPNMVSGRRSAFARGISSEGQIVVSAVEFGGGGQVSLPSVSVFRAGMPSGSIRSTDASVVPYVECVATANEDVLWCTSYGTLWLSREGSSAVSNARYSSVERMSETGSGIIASTYDRGLIIIPIDEIRTSVSVRDMDQTCYARAYPNPVERGEPVCIDISGCRAFMFNNIEVINLAGCVAYGIDLNSHDAGNELRIDLSQELPPGPYWIRVHGGGCTHTIPIVITN
jgi:hypothetical protein